QLRRDGDAGADRHGRGSGRDDVLGRRPRREGDGGGIGQRIPAQRPRDGGRAGGIGRGERGGVGTVVVVGDRAERAGRRAQRDRAAAGGQVVAVLVLELHG